MSVPNDRQRENKERYTGKQRQTLTDAQKEQQKIRRYTIIGVVIVVLVAALLIWNSGILEKKVDAASIGDHSYSVAEVNFYYYQAYNSTYNMANTYSQYGIDTGYDTSLAPEDQMYDENAGTTYADYFRQTALDSLQQTTILCDEASADGYTLSDEGKSSVESQMNSVTMYSTKYGYSEEAYLKMAYGQDMSKTLFKKMVTNEVLADEYKDWKTEQFPCTDEDLNNYYQENAASLDTYDYRYCYISNDVTSTTDESGNTVDPTDEETAAGMAAAKEKADAMVARVEKGEAFNTVAMDYVGDDYKDSYSDPDYNRSADSMGSDISSYPYGSWLMEDGRVSGDLTVVEQTGYGYYVVEFLSREQDNSSYETVDVRHILIKAETTSTTTTDSDGNQTETDLPTDEQLAAAKTKAEDLLAQWKAGDATADSFAALANEYSEDPGSNTNGGLYEGVSRGQMIDSFNDWIFDPTRQIGDTGIVENTDDNGNVVGYHIMYLQAFGEIRWKYTARTDLQSTAFTDWYNGLTDSYQITTLDGMSSVGT